MKPVFGIHVLKVEVPLVLKEDSCRAFGWFRALAVTGLGLGFRVNFRM